MHVVLFDAETRSSLAALRALSGKGITTVCASYKSNALSFYSSSCQEKFVYPNPNANKNAFVESIRQYLNENPTSVFYTFTDTTTDALQIGVKERKLPKHVLCGPSWEKYEYATNKRMLAMLATTYTIPVPQEVTSEIVESSPESLTYPLIIKPVRSVSWSGASAYKDTAYLAETPNELRVAYMKLKQATHQEPLVQNTIYGDEYGVSVCAHQGKLIAVFAHKRLRSIKKYGGASTLRESVVLTDEMLYIAKSLARALEWNGVMMIELKRNNKTNKLTLIEINARFWGSLFLAITAGVNFPYILYRCSVLGACHSEIHSYTEGVRARHLITDISHFYSLGWSAFQFGNIVKFFAFWQKKLYYDVLSFNDPVPGFVEIFQFIRKKI